MYARRSQYDTRMRDMKEFFQFAQISKSLQRRLIDYFNATWSKRKGMQQVDSTLQTFPANLRGEIFQHLHREFLNLPGILMMFFIKFPKLFINPAAVIKIHNRWVKSAS